MTSSDCLILNTNQMHFFYFAKSVCLYLDFDFRSLTTTLGKFDDKENRF